MFYTAAVACLVLSAYTEAYREIGPVGWRFRDQDQLFRKITFEEQVAPRDVNTKITEGYEPAQNEFPFVARLLGASGGFCSGILVANQYVLTSMSCYSNYSPDRALFGDYDLEVIDGTEQQINITQAFVSPMADPSKLNGTVLLMLQSKPILGDATQIGSIVNSEAYMARVLNNERRCLQLGWGYVLVDDVWMLPRKMQAIEVNWVSDSEMVRRGYSYYVSRGQAGTEAVYADECNKGGACFGDEGAPVVCKRGGDWTVAGFYARGDRTDGCMTGVKATENAFKYYDWVQEQLRAP